MTSSRLREIGASVRHAALTGTDATITIDHKEYRVSMEKVNETKETKEWWLSWTKGGTWDKVVASAPGEEFAAVEWKADEIEEIAVRMTCDHEPTEAEIRAFVKEQTNGAVVLPDPEQPRWWYWAKNSGWHMTGWERFSYADNEEGDPVLVRVFATTATRDAERDRIIAGVKALLGGVSNEQ